MLFRRWIASRAVQYRVAMEKDNQKEKDNLVKEIKEDMCRGLMLIYSRRRANGQK